jgi:HlyD family secretion protein
MAPIGEKTPKKKPRNSRRFWWIAGSIAAVSLLGLLWWWRTANQPPVLTTMPVTKGTLVQTVTATGTVIARDTINVGTQISGTLSDLFVDYNSRVKVGQVLAKIDPSTFQSAVDRDRAQLAQALGQAASSASMARAAGSSAQAAIANVDLQRANFASAQAGIASADAQVVKAQAALDVAQLTVNRDTQLIAQGYIAQSTVDADRSNRAAAQAALTAAQITARQARLGAASAQAQYAAQGQTAAASQAQTQAAAQTTNANQAAVAAAQAQLQSDLINLQRTVIASPVNGTVISRAVSVGQTVAASFQTPTLFSIAEDLGQMELDLSVGEPDMGSIKNGEAIDFTVLAYPTTTFHATVAQVRENPTTVNNVVTYIVVAYVPNPGGKLFPGMTANASIHVAKVQNALIVPLSALQWQPSSGGSKRRSQAGGAAQSGGGTAASGASPWGQTGGASSGAIVAGTAGRVFAQNHDGSTTQIPVSIDLVSGGNAAVTPLEEDGLREGDLVVTGQQTTAQAAAATSGNPFQPPRPPGAVPRSAR